MAGNVIKKKDKNGRFLYYREDKNGKLTRISKDKASMESRSTEKEVEESTNNVLTIEELNIMTIAELINFAEIIGLKSSSSLSKDDLVNAIFDYQHNGNCDFIKIVKGSGSDVIVEENGEIDITKEANEKILEVDLDVMRKIIQVYGE